MSGELVRSIFGNASPERRAVQVVRQNEELTQARIESISRLVSVAQRETVAIAFEAAGYAQVVPQAAGHLEALGRLGVVSMGSSILRFPG